MIYPQRSSYLIAYFILWHLPQIWYQWPDKKDDFNFVTESSYHLFLGSPLLYGEIRFAHCVSFLCCVFFVCLSSVSYVHSCTVLSIVRSWLPLRFSLKFNFDAFFGRYHHLYLNVFCHCCTDDEICYWQLYFCSKCTIVTLLYRPVSSRTISYLNDG